MDALERYADSLEAEIEQAARRIQLMESGKVSFRSRTADTDWTDDTQELIAENYETIRVLRGVIEGIRDHIKRESERRV